MTKLYDMWPTNQAVPAGYEKLAELQERLGRDETLRRLQTSIIVASELNTEDGRIDPVHVDYWRSELADEMLKTGYKKFYFSPDKPINPANAREIFQYGQTWNLLLVDLVDEYRTSITSARVGGRPLKYDWAGAAAFVASYLVEKDFPPQQSVLAKAVTAWFKRRGKVPEDAREVDRWVAEIYKERDALTAQRKQKPVG